MAVGHYDDLVIRDAEFQAGFAETVAQQTNAFNGASAGTILLEPNQVLEGHYKKEKFFDLNQISITRRDITSASAQTAAEVKEVEEIGVKLSWKADLMEQDLESFLRANRDINEFSFLYGQGVAAFVQQYMLNAALYSLQAAIGGTAAVVYDGTAANLSHASLIAGIAKMGDYGEMVRCFVAHSDPFYDLMSGSITVASGNVAGMTIYEGMVGTINRRMVVTDSAALLLDQTTDNYYTLGLVPGACSLVPHPPRVFSRVELGKESVTFQWQSEGDFYVTIKGYAWDETNGGINPAVATTLATGSNWDKYVTSDKDGPGIQVTSL